MIIGRTSAGKIQIKTDSPLGLRAVECACCEENPCNYENVCINGVKIIFSGPDACNCGGSPEDPQLCANDIFSCYFMVFACWEYGNYWTIYFLKDAGGGEVVPCSVSLFSDSPFGTYTDTSGGPCAGSTITVSQCP